MVAQGSYETTLPKSPLGNSPHSPGLFTKRYTGKCSAPSSWANKAGEERREVRRQWQNRDRTRTLHTPNLVCAVREGPRSSVPSGWSKVPVGFTRGRAAWRSLTGRCQPQGVELVRAPPWLRQRGEEARRGRVQKFPFLNSFS